MAQLLRRQTQKAASTVSMNAFEILFVTLPLEIITVQVNLTACLKVNTTLMSICLSQILLRGFQLPELMVFLNSFLLFGVKNIFSLLFYQVKEFEKNEAFIKHLPYDYTWWFRVSIFDQMSGKWSKFSPPSRPLKIGLGKSLNSKFL